MKVRFLLFFALFSLSYCHKDPKNAADNWHRISQNVQFKNEGDYLSLRSTQFRYTIPKSALPYKRVVLLNASLIGYFAELGLENTIVGVSSPEYIYSPKIHELINSGKIKNIGNEQKYDVEKIIGLKPDVIFSNHITSFANTYDIIRKNGIEIIFLDEYLEQNALEKSGYLEVFGVLFDKEKQAAKRFAFIKENYESLRTYASKAKEKPVVLANEMYGNQWFLPGGKSTVAQYISDANATYINQENSSANAVPMNFEEVFAKAKNAKYWINAGNHKSKKSLLQVNPNYAAMNVFNHGKIYAVTGKEKSKANDYFESGVVRADLVLKDYIAIFHPELFPDYEFTYMKELK